VFKGQSKVRLLPLGRLRSRKTKNPSLHPLKKKATTAASRSRSALRFWVRRRQQRRRDPSSDTPQVAISLLKSGRNATRVVSRSRRRQRHRRDQVFKGQSKVRLLPLGRLRSRKTKNPSLHPLKKKAMTAASRSRRRRCLRRPEDYRYHKATEVNMSTSKPIFVDSQESTDTLPTSKKEERQDYVAREVDILRTYMKGRDIDSANWSLCYLNPCPQQGSGDDCAIFTYKYMECLARRDTQGFPFSQDDMPTVRARFTLHFIKAYFNAQERSE
ncbi:hypothetical protein Taro_019140, partial [Colocasia esculenta]|nr:hypothetical protein [Colocasia esculenta]